MGPHSAANVLVGARRMDELFDDLCDDGGDSEAELADEPSPKGPKGVQHGDEAGVEATAGGARAPHVCRARYNLRGKVSGG
jgi:hypothetical protein